MSLRDKEFERDLVASEIVGVMRAIQREPALPRETRELIRVKLEAWDAANAAVRQLRQAEWT